MLDANGLGEFEERFAGGVYLLDTWLEWLETFDDMKNQLMCYLLEKKQLTDQGKFFWCGAVLVGIHITIPFMSMLLYHRVNP